MAEDKNKTAGSGQQGNQNWDEQNDQQRSGNQEPNPERFSKGGSAFNEEPVATGYGNVKNTEENVDPMDPNEDVPPIESTNREDEGTNKTGPGLG